MNAMAGRTCRRRTGVSPDAEHANVGERDHVIDLGSGDGVIVITRAPVEGQRLRVDIDEELVRLSNQRAKSLGIDGRCASK